METWVKTSTILLAEVTQALAGILIGFAVVRAVIMLLRPLAMARAPETSTESIRLTLGRWLALALEFLLAADILMTAVAPTWEEIGQLAAIIVIRTALNFFLQREIDVSLARERSTAGGGSV